MITGPKIPWRAGRKDVDARSVQALPDGRLPNANMVLYTIPFYSAYTQFTFVCTLGVSSCNKLTYP